MRDMYFLIRFEIIVVSEEIGTIIETFCVKVHPALHN